MAEDLTPGYDGTPGPSDTLRALAALSLVSRAFRTLAQTHLFAEVTISTKVDVERFFAVVGAGDRSRSVARLVRTLRVGRLDSSNSLMFRGALHLTRAEEYGLDDLLKACSNITELKLASVEEVELESLRFVPSESYF